MGLRMASSFMLFTQIGFELSKRGIKNPVSYLWDRIRHIFAQNSNISAKIKLPEK